MNKLLTRGPVWELDIEQDADWLFAKVGGQNQELTSYLSRCLTAFGRYFGSIR